MIEDYLGQGRHGLKTRATGRKQPPRAGVIHRLDADAAGLLVFSKNNFAYHAPKAQFFRHSVQRIYHAVVHGVPRSPAERIESRLVEWTDGTVHSTKPPKGQVAVTHY